MAALLIQGQEELVKVDETYIGKNGDVIIMLDRKGDIFLNINPLQAQLLINSLRETLRQYHEQLGNFIESDKVA